MAEHDKKSWHEFKEKHQSEENSLKSSEKDETCEETTDFDGIEQAHEIFLDHPSYEELSAKLTRIEQESHENKEKSLRALAELDNVRRRAEREVANAHRYGVEKLISALLPVIDSLEQALQRAVETKETSMCEGLELTLKLFVDVLQKFDVQAIDPVGTSFDPQLHEAIAMQEAADQKVNTVLAVVQKGYTLNDRVIRAARVIVAKK